MPFYITKGYSHAVPAGISPPGSILLCGAMPMHQLVRREPKKKLPPKRESKKPHRPRPAHEAHRLFDPQLYLADLNVHQSPDQCLKLATYPWFGVDALKAYDSSQQDQSQWRSNAKRDILSVGWPSRAPTADSIIDLGVRECVDLQMQLGCEAIILPSPLTVDAGTSYDTELRWLEAGLAYAREVADVPVLATVSISDICLRQLSPDQNGLLDLIADAVSARGVDGIYLVIEQASEASDTRLCGTPRTLASALHLTHLFARDANLKVVVTFLGAFGAVCQIAGASIWSCGWYKSLHRLRLADQGAPGRVMPSFWTNRAVLDVSVDRDFDALASAALLNAFAERTPASAGLLDAAARGIPSNNVPAWTYKIGNKRGAEAHFYYCALALDQWLTTIPEPNRADSVEQWLTNATAIASQIALIAATSARAASQATGRPVAAKTNTGHVSAWAEGVRIYRRIHST